MTLPPRCVALVFMLSLAAAGGTPQRAQAQSTDYPNRPVSFIVPFAPGGVTSLFARILGQKLEQRFGKPFVVENRPGAGGVTAAAAVANATPDGYTIMMASSTVLAINVTMRKHSARRGPARSIISTPKCSRAFSASTWCMFPTRVRRRRSTISSAATSR
jgi:tripartite-type tricarboxylate transporter receptor subunit TctC